MKKKTLHFAWFVLIGIILIRGFAGGGLNAVSALFLVPASEELGVGIGSLSIYFSITSIATILWLPFAGKLINHWDIRLAAVTGGCLQTFAFIGFGMLNSVFQWYLLAVPYAMGSAILTNLLGPVLIHRWFAKDTGLVIGIMMAFTGLFGIVFQPFTSWLIAAEGWRRAYFTLGAVVFAVVMLSTFLFLRNKPLDRKLLPYGQGEGNSRESDQAAQNQFSIPETDAIRSPTFYLLLIFMVSITGVGVFSQHIPNLGRTLGYSASHTGMAMAFVSAGTAAGSIAIGLISDRINILKTCYGILAAGFIAVMGFLFSGVSFILFGLSAFLHGLASSGIMVLAPILTLEFFGQQDYEKIYAKIAMGAPLASILLIPAYGFVYDELGNYFYVFLGMAVLLGTALLCITLSWKKRCEFLDEEK